MLVDGELIAGAAVARAGTIPAPDPTTTIQPQPTPQPQPDHEHHAQNQTSQNLLRHPLTVSSALTIITTKS